MNVVYREARPADAGAIAALHADSWRRTYRGIYPDAFLDGDLLAERRGVWDLRLGRPAPGQFVCVAHSAASLVGFLCGFGSEDPTWGSLIDNLHVHHAHRRLGIGAELMRRAASSFASHAPAGGVYLWVLEGNVGARAFYERLGASNAEVVARGVQAGATARVCRYVWEDPAELLTSLGRVG